MEIIKLEEKHSMDSVTESHYSFVSSLRYAMGKHTHDFYEFFIITDGKVIHNVNNRLQYLLKGSLVFIRPEDVHYYESDQDSDCQFINIPYTSKAVWDAFNFLGESFNPERLIMSHLPPISRLTPIETANLIKRLQNLFIMSSEDKSQIRIELRSILIEILTRYFPKHQEQVKDSVPKWFEALLIDIQAKDVFTDGLQRIYEISGKSHVHINRTFRRYLNMKPTEYVNSLRMNYAKNMILNTDMDILDISMEAGYDNLSHFYHLFKKCFNTSPAKYRKKYRRSFV